MRVSLCVGPSEAVRVEIRVRVKVRVRIQVGVDTRRPSRAIRCVVASET